MPLTVKRIYDPPADSDGYRVLVDRLWPRGVSKQKAALDEWAKQLSPSDDLRKRFHGHPEKWSEFQTAYRRELEANLEEVNRLRERAKHGHVTLLFAAKEPEKNNARVLADLLEED